MRNRSGFGWLELAIGILLIVLGIMAFANPDFAVTGLVLAYGFAAVTMGVADIILYIRVERFIGFGPIFSLISGILSVMSGIMLIAYPGTGVMVLTVLLPIWFIAHCLSRLANLNHVRFVAGNGMYYFSLIVNVIGLILGFLVLIRPLFTLAALRYFISAYLILLGIDALVVAISRMGHRF